jgi:ubiquinone/menaquinone biosynthesis C-methylase UbiE
MAVVYMKKLEEEPESYDEKFTSLTKGVNTKVKEWILQQVENKSKILEVGCGTGSFSNKLVNRKNVVLAIDNNQKMIDYAKRMYSSSENENLSFKKSSSTEWNIPEEKFDYIISTFMLSELRPFEQQIFLRNAWNSLKNDGKLILAAEFVPSGIRQISFRIKRWRYRRKLGRVRKGEGHPLKNFKKYLKPMSYKLENQKEWNGGAIQTLILKRDLEERYKRPGYYEPEFKDFQGLKSQLNVFRCLLTGQIDHIPIEPGIYRSGNPDKNSPIIATSNYIYTYIKVMRALKGIDAWVLCVDSRGINVWCAARGGNFGVRELLEAVKATNIEELTNTRTIILPQLSAGGVDSRVLPQNSQEFPFKIKYGPVWAKNLPEYLETQPARKPEKMKIAKFSLKHRMRAGLTHLTFLLRKVFLWPLLGLLLVAFGLNTFSPLNISYINIGEIIIWIGFTNLIIAGLFPIVNFTRKFLIKGLSFGILNVILLGSLTWIFYNSIVTILFFSPFFLWLGFFCTMSFSGYTFATNPGEIQEEYPIFRDINLVLLVVSVILLLIGILFF